MTVYQGVVSLKGQNGKIVKRFFDLGDFNEISEEVNFSAAEAALSQITGALAAVTDATISETRLTALLAQDATPGAGDVFENAMLNLHLDPAGEKLGQHYIPAPVIGVFLATDGVNRDVVDTADADLIQYVQQIAQHAFISDGEQVDQTVNNGIRNGVRTVRSLKLGV